MSAFDRCVVFDEDVSDARDPPLLSEQRYIQCEKKRVLKINCEHSHALLCETSSFLRDMTHSLAGEIDIYDNALINILTRSFFYLFSANFSDRIPLVPRGV